MRNITCEKLILFSNADYRATFHFRHQNCVPDGKGLFQVLPEVFLRVKSARLKSGKLKTNYHEITYITKLPNLTLCKVVCKSG